MECPVLGGIEAVLDAALDRRQGEPDYAALYNVIHPE
jgi:hypothetical protein